MWMKTYKQKVLCMQCMCEGCVYGKFCSLDCIYSPFLLPPFPSSPLPPLSLSTSLISLSPLLPLSSHRECPKRRVSQPRPRGNVPAQEGVPRVIGETPSRCCPLCLPGDTEKRVLWTARTKWYGNSFPFPFHHGLIPIPIPSWSQSHSSFFVASFPFPML